MKRNSTKPNKGIAGSGKGGSGYALPANVVMRRVDAERSRPEPPICPAEVQEKLRIARREMADLTNTLEWFLFQSHVRIRNRWRQTFGDDWHYFVDLVGCMRGESAFQLIHSESPYLQQKHPQKEV